MKKRNFYRNLFEKVQKSSILWSFFNQTNNSSKRTFQNFICKFLHEGDLSTGQQKTSIPYHENHYYYPRNINFLSRCFTSSRRSTGFHTPSPNEFHPIRDNPFAGSRKRGGVGQRAERRGREGEGKSCAAARRSNGGGRREALREGKGSVNESATSKCHATPLFVT